MLIDEFWQRLDPAERSIANFAANDPNYISVKQLFWLRDIKDKYV